MSRVSGPALIQVLDLMTQPSGTYLIRASDGLNRQGVVRVSKQ